MAFVAIPNSGGWKYDNAATAADTYSDTPGTISGGIRTHTTLGGAVRETYIKCRKTHVFPAGNGTYLAVGELDKTFLDNYTPRGTALYPE